MSFAEDSVSYIRVIVSPLPLPESLVKIPESQVRSNHEQALLRTMAMFSKTPKAPERSDLDGKGSENSHVEDVDSIKAVDEKAQGDYSGATTKVDPVEIKLVRKLDMRIMPILWAMYFLNYVCRTYQNIYFGFSRGGG